MARKSKCNYPAVEETVMRKTLSSPRWGFKQFYLDCCNEEKHKIFLAARENVFTFVSVNIDGIYLFLSPPTIETLLYVAPPTLATVNGFCCIRTQLFSSFASGNSICNGRDRECHSSLNCLLADLISCFFIVVGILYSKLQQYLVNL